MNFVILITGRVMKRKRRKNMKKVIALLLAAVMTFVLAGIFIGITAILQISYANSITTVSSLRSISMIFQPLMGVLIAFAIQEWCNLTLGVFISQFTLSMMFNALIALGVPSKMQDVVLGVMLIIVMGIALNNKRISGFFERKARRKELMKRA